MPSVEAYETWNLEYFRNLLPIYSRKMSIEQVKRLIRYINFCMYEDFDEATGKGGKYHLKTIVSRAAKAFKGLKESTLSDLELEEESKCTCGAICTLNPYIISDIMAQKNCPVTKAAFRSVLWVILSGIPRLVERFIKEGGLGANQDFWITESIRVTGHAKSGSPVQGYKHGRGHKGSEAGDGARTIKGAKQTKRARKQ